MTITRWAITRTRVTWMAIILLVVAGLLSYNTLPKAEDPGFTMRTAIITTVMPGASPRRVEQLITAPIEEAIQEIPEVTGITSVSRSGRSSVTAEIDEELADIDPILAEIRDAVEDARAELPGEALEPEVNTDVAKVYDVLLAMTYEGFPHTDAVHAAEQIKEQLLLVGDASEAEVFGDQERQILLEFDHARLSRMGLSPESLIGLIQSSNIMSPGGELSVGEERLSIEPSGAFTRVEDVADLAVRLPDGALVRLGDLVTVRDGFERPKAARAFYNGKPALLIGAVQRDGGNSQRFGRDARERIAEVQGRLPVGLEISEVAFQPDNVDARIDNFMQSLYQSVAIVFVVILLFLGVRTGAIVASIIPLVILATFALMSLFGVGIDQMSLAALLLALGMLVDNAIVMAETTSVRMQQGDSAADAVVTAASELWIPLLISSLTTCAAFLPVYLAPGGASEFVAPIFYVVTIALLSSWAIALTILPALSVPFLPQPKEASEDIYDTPLYNRFRAVIRGALRYRWVTFAAAVVALLATLSLFGMVDNEFFAPSDNPRFLAEVTLPDGIDEDIAEDAWEKLDRFVQAEMVAGPDREHGVVSYGVMLGDSLPRFNLSARGPGRGTGNLALLFNTTDRAVVDELVLTFLDFVEAEMIGARAKAAPLALGPGGGADVAFTLIAEDEAQLMNAVDGLTAELRQQPGVRNVRNNWGNRIKKLDVDIDPVRLRLAGLSNQNVATSLMTALSGIEASELREGDERYPIVLRSTEQGVSGISGLRALTVFGQNNNNVALQQVANVGLVLDYAQIHRDGRERAVEISADVAGALPSDVQAHMEGWAAQAIENVDISAAGEQADSAEANQKLLSNVPFAGLIIMMLLVLQFNSFRRMIVNLTVLPFSFIGVILGLLLLDASFGFIALLAVISLFGILLNNGIVLIDRIDTEVAGGLPITEALVEASVHRLRPILMTTITTTAGLIPLYLGGGSTFEGMAVTLMGGLIGGTALTLVLVPVTYALVFRIRFE